MLNNFEDMKNNNQNIGGKGFAIFLMVVLWLLLFTMGEVKGRRTQLTLYGVSFILVALALLS